MVVVDSKSVKEGSTKSEQFAVLEEAYRPFGSIAEFKVLTEDEFASYIAGI